MTCIVAIVERGSTWMGADSLVSDDSGRVATIRTPKIVRLRNALLGCSGTWADLQAVSRWLAQRQIRADALRSGELGERLRAWGRETFTNGSESGAVLLLAVDGALFLIDSGFGVLVLIGRTPCGRT